MAGAGGTRLPPASACAPLSPSRVRGPSAFHAGTRDATSASAARPTCSLYTVRPPPRSTPTVMSPSSGDSPAQVAAATPRGLPGSPVTRHPDREEPPDDSEAARVQLIVEIGGKITAAHAHATDWHWVSSLGLTDLTGQGAVEQIVLRAIQRSLGLPTVSSRHMRLEPVQLESPSSWDGLAEFARSGGTFRVAGRLYGGRSSRGGDPAVSPPLIEQENDLATSPTQNTRRALPPPPPTSNAQI